MSDDDYPDRLPTPYEQMEKAAREHRKEEAGRLELAKAMAADEERRNAARSRRSKPAARSRPSSGPQVRYPPPGSPANLRLVRLGEQINLAGLPLDHYEAPHLLWPRFLRASKLSAWLRRLINGSSKRR